MNFISLHCLLSMDWSISGYKNCILLKLLNINIIMILKFFLYFFFLCALQANTEYLLYKHITSVESLIKGWRWGMELDKQLWHLECHQLGYSNQSTWPAGGWMCGLLWGIPVEVARSDKLFTSYFFWFNYVN